MAYDNQGAAVGAAGHYAAALTAALITAGVVTSAEDALDTFDGFLSNTFQMCEQLKGTLPEQAAPTKKAWGGRKSSGGNSAPADPGAVDFRGGKYAGQTIASVYDEDPGYLEWCVGNLKNDFMVSRIEQYLATVAA